MLRDLLKAKAAAKKDPEFYETQAELAHKLKWATMMREAGQLTKAEFQEFESHLTSEYLSALPVGDFIEMQKDGRYADLEAIAGHDGKRDGYSVRKDRAALNKKITEAALDEAWTTGKIDDKMYAQEQRKLGKSDDEISQRVTDADADGGHDAVSLDIFFERNMPPDPEPEPGTVPRLPESITSPPALVEDNRIKSADED